MRFLVLLLALIFSPAALAQEKAQAVFAGGCFWCMESDMQHLPGVISVESGYTGGKEQNPTYRQVAMHRTGHYESVRVTFDPKKITYEQLLSRYWPLIDPTDAYGQFCDRGQSYAPAIFVTPEQQVAATRSKKARSSRRAASTARSSCRSCRWVISGQPRNTTATTPSRTR
jgi:peptide-methionine (S)-S-oxide reductase